MQPPMFFRRSHRSIESAGWLRSFWSVSKVYGTRRRKAKCVLQALATLYEKSLSKALRLLVRQYGSSGAQQGNTQPRRSA
jgi:hypothetical protein